MIYNQSNCNFVSTLRFSLSFPSRTNNSMEESQIKWTIYNKIVDLLACESRLLNQWGFLFVTWGFAVDAGFIQNWCAVRARYSWKWAWLKPGKNPDHAPNELLTYRLHQIPGYIIKMAKLILLTIDTSFQIHLRYWQRDHRSMIQLWSCTFSEMAISKKAKCHQHATDEPTGLWSHVRALIFL